MSLFDNCVLYWDGNPSVEVYGRTLTLTNSPTQIADRFGISNRALDNGTDATKGILLPTSISDYVIGTGQFTVVFMCKTSTSQATYTRMYSNGFTAGSDEFNVELIGNCLAVYGAWGTHDTLGTTTINDGILHTLAVTRNSSGVITGYIDGVAEGNPVTHTNAINGATSGVNSIGVSYSSNYGFKGSYEAFLLYKGRCLSVSELISLDKLLRTKYIYPYKRGERWCE